MILADTSAWVEYLRGTGSPAHLRLRSAVVDDVVATTDVIMLEVLAGSRPDRAEADQRLLQTVDFLAQHLHADADIDQLARLTRLEVVPI